MTDRDIMQQALEALENNPATHAGLISRKQAITTLRQALVDADDTSQERVDEMVKTEHDRAVELGQAYERGWNAALVLQEPVAWLSTDCIGERYLCFTKPKDNDPVQPLYTTPPKREWVGLTDEEIQKVVSKKWWDWEDLFDIEGFSRAIEVKLREKNT